MASISVLAIDDENLSLVPTFAQEHSLTEDGKIGGMMGAIRKNTLPQSLKKQLIDISKGAIVGVVELERRFCLFRLEEILPATLEGRLK